MAKLFLMRWNPAISSYKLDAYHRNCEDFPDGFCIDWSIWDYNEANPGDCFVMMRVGEYRPGIVFYGSFVSAPYADEDWAGTDKKRQYVLMDCFGFIDNDDPIIPTDVIHTAAPEIYWMHGHSGVMLSEYIAVRITRLLGERIPDFAFNPDWQHNDGDGYFKAVEKLPELVEEFKQFNPSIHSHDGEGYDWLETDEDCCRCLLIPNPNTDDDDIEIETRGEFILYFAGSHAHYENDETGYKSLLEDISDIIIGNTCAYSCMYDDWAWYRGLTSMLSSEDQINEFLKEDDEYFIRMLAEYTEKDVRMDGVLTIELHYFDSLLNKSYSFRLDELSDKVDKYKKRQKKIRELYGD